MKKTEVLVQEGDIAQVSTDALITAINSEGMWFGGIDGVIQRAAGNLFHARAAASMPLTHEQAVIAYSGSRAHRGAFKNVVFVVDDLQGPLRNIVYQGLKAAHDAGFKTVTLPTIRMGVMLGAVEKTQTEALNEMTQGVRTFLLETPEGLDRITFVVYNNPDLKRELESALTR